MKNKKLTFAIVVAFIIGLIVFVMQLGGDNVALLNPKGLIANSERNLLVFTVLLSMIVVVPVFFMTFYFAYKYREGNTKTTTYTPDWDHNNLAEIIWWGVPLILIIILSAITFKSSHDLDPFKPIESDVATMNVQVVALQWKWLFIYPDYGVASVNYLPFPESTPVNFSITSDAPMNSFWIPELGGQIYAMSGMTTQLNLMADKTGVYSGSSANISGKGFSQMRFKAESLTSSDFESWVESAKQSSNMLDVETYDDLAMPGEVKEPIVYAVDANDDVFHNSIMKYMMHGHTSKPEITSDEMPHSDTVNDDVYDERMTY